MLSSLCWCCIYVIPYWPGLSSMFMIGRSYSSSVCDWLSLYFHDRVGLFILFQLIRLVFKKTNPAQRHLQVRANQTQSHLKNLLALLTRPLLNDPAPHLTKVHLRLKLVSHLHHLLQRHPLKMTIKQTSPQVSFSIYGDSCFCVGCMVWHHYTRKQINWFFPVVYANLHCKRVRIGVRIGIISLL